jgi:hypothetical protein
MAKRRKFSSTEREAVAQRAQGSCEYCQVPEDFCPDTFEMEHITPLAHGGNNELNNIAFSCSGCNQAKGVQMEAVDPVTQLTVRLFNPRRDDWQVHFRWIDGFTRVEGVTPIGRATIECLEFNRTGCINLRRALIAVGAHPRLHH